VCGSEDDCIYLWDLKTQDIVQRIEGHKGVDRVAIHSPIRDRVWTVFFISDALAFAQRPYWECPVTPLSGYSHQVRWSRILLYGCGRMPR